MKYRNIKTGLIVDFPTKINSPIWEEVTAKAGNKPAKAEAEEKPKDKPKAKPKAAPKKEAKKRGKAK